MKELSKAIPVNLEMTRSPQYGRLLGDFSVGDVYRHPRGITIDRAFAVEFATTFMEANPLYLNAEYARACGYPDLLVSPMMVLNITISLGVQNDSEKALANLGYEDITFPQPVLPGDTLRGMTQILKIEPKEGRPGIVTFRTAALNQRDQPVCHFRRKIMVPPGRLGREPSKKEVRFPEPPTNRFQIPEPKGGYPTGLTGFQSYFENFTAGEIILHPNGRTVTDEHIPWTYRLMNTHPLHFDSLYATQAKLAEGKEIPVVYGGLIIAWITGLASRDTSENALWDLGYTEGYHSQPVTSGDTLFAISRILSKGDESSHLGTVTCRLIGLKDIRPRDALQKYGAELFTLEVEKKPLGLEKIVEKVFETERKLLVKKRG